MWPGGHFSFEKLNIVVYTIALALQQTLLGYQKDIQLS